VALEDVLLQVVEGVHFFGADPATVVSIIIEDHSLDILLMASTLMLCKFPLILESLMAHLTGELL
jgi:hypothetical protein